MPLQPQDIKSFIQDAVPRVSSSTFNQKNYERDKKAWVANKFELYKKKPRNSKYKSTVLTKSDIDRIITDIDLQCSISKSVQRVPLAEALKLLGWTRGLDAFYTHVHIQKLVDPPTVWYGPSTSSGHYVPGTNRIYIDIRKNRSVPERLKTLEFEVVNASHRDARKRLETSNVPAVKKAWESIKLEYQVSKLELKKLLHAHNVSSPEKLVEAMGINKSSLPPTPIYNEAKIKTQRVKMPGVGQLSDKDKRTAIFWYLVRAWKDEEIIKEYAYRPHTPGGTESTLDQEIRKFQK